MKEENKGDYRVPLDFVRCFAHDVRSPLAVIFGAIDNWRDLGLEGDVEETRRIFKAIHSSAKTITRRVDEASEYSSVLDGDKKVFPKSFDIWNCFDEAAIDLDSRREDLTLYDPHGLYHVVCRGEQLKRGAIKSPVEAYGDPVLTRIVLFNLLGNAVKYSRTSLRGERQIEIDIINDPDAVRFWVHNDCERQIPEEFYDRLFEKGFTLPEHAEEGHGLGLYFCKRMIELQNGIIRAESGLGENGPYARFSFALPKPPEIND